MRSSKKKKADPKRDIDNFLSKFDEPEDVAEYNSEPSSDSPEESASRQTFQWKEVEPVKSKGKKSKKSDKAERQVTKDPAPSAIKVQRVRDDEEDDVPAFRDEGTTTKTSKKPEAVEPERASDVISHASSESENNKEAAELKNEDSSPEKILDEMFGDSEALDDTSSESPSEKKEAFNPGEKIQTAFKSFVSLFSMKKEEPVDIHTDKDEEEDIDFIEELTPSSSDETSDDSSEKKEVSEETESEAESIEDKEPEESEASEEVVASEEDAASEDSVTEEENEESQVSDSEKDSEVSDAEEEKQESEDAEDKTSLSEEDSSTELPVAAASYSVSELLNKPKEDRTPPNTDYFADPESGEYIKVDLGARKRIEHRVLKSKRSGLFRRKARKPKEKKTLKQILFLKKNPDYNPEQGDTYERDGKIIKNKKWKFSFLKLFRDFAIVGLLMIMTVAGIFGYIIYKSPVFNYNDMYATVATSSLVYNDEGKQIDSIYYTENRRIVKYEDMPENLIESFVAIEDKTFWKHHGFNWTRMIGAVISSITGHGQISGTSTITQQLARNIYLPEIKSERSIKRKVQEMYYAARLEHAHTKEEIVEAYLNTIYLGYGCYGVNAAARTYFSKSVADLSVLESAALAALPQAPDNYALLKNAAEGGEVSEDSKVISKSPDKIVTNDISKSRRNLTLDLMLEQNLITKDEYKESYDKPLNDFIDPTLKSTSNKYTYFHDYLVDTLVADLMEQYGLSYEEAERKVYTGGLQIYSTIDSEAQTVIVDEFKDDANFPYVSAYYDGDGNILNNDGEIALYDYEDYFDEDDNFRLSGDNDEIEFKEDGSAVINKGHNLLIYETEVNGATDYSIEFKNYYFYDGNTLYSIQGGFVNIPAEFKSGDEDGNVVVSADFFNDSNYKEIFVKDGDDLIIKDTGYSLGRNTRQPQAAMVIVQVGTGEVKAMVGGRQFKGEKLLNRAVGTRQPGSSIKPLAVYGAALQKSYELQKDGKKWEYVNYKVDRQGTRGYGDYITAHSSVEDERTKINGKYWPKNATGGYSGTNNFRTAIQQSINTCAVKLELQITPEYAIKQLKKFGITTTVDVDQNDKVNDVNLAAMALGAMTEGVQPLEMALAYAAFPGGGKVNTPVCYTKVLDRNGKEILTGNSKQTEAMNEGVAWIMTDVLQSVVSRGIAWPAAIDDVTVGGKTGTTNDQYDIWFDGFTPSYAAALWIGTDQNVEMSTMSGPAATLWGKIMSQIPKAKEGKYKKQPDNVIEYYGEYYTEGTEVGLSSWSYAAEKRKARNAAYSKWKSQRENHKHKVVDEPAHKEYSKKVYDIYYKKDENGNVIKDKNGKPIEEKRVLNEEKSTKIKVEEKWHWEYDKGWRDGDFCYSFDGHTYCE